ncbi:dihydroxyacetone phosphate acyltransferase isoform X1 [Stegostoma tigrinum]|uniref:dihydroxyacetone phosphate acyltransferase isoform X1 n=2 Tax=Stegostoma tigrinum TaxID=3053191 RepID=UPI00202B2B75|nr:dihydroxyacetone phosphate acyltransferase isoform X1 [Stegostoma tigrinum]
MSHLVTVSMAPPAVESLYPQKDMMLNKRDGFEDLMEERRHSSDLRYAMRCYTPVVYKDLVPRTPSALRSIVLKSDQVQYVIRQLSKETGESPDIINDEAADILEKMGHGLRLSVVRFFAFTLSKIFKALFQKVRVNEEGIQKLHQAIQEYPVVLLPSHRSYIDFLMLSYIMYTYDLCLPVIAAGMDFMGMKIVGEMLRMSGAFFIRRSFGGDKLYWAVFSEYVKTILRNGDAPVEFFVEGTRSRTGKSLTPKLGLLNIAIEPFLMGEVFDMYLVPISISYERILEESLYAHELLGVPKPKESTSGLLKARKILSENFGSIHVYFGQPVSVRSLATGAIKRSQYNLVPRHIPRKPCGDVHRFLDAVGHRMVMLQQKNMVISSWALIATVIIQNLPSIPLSDLTRQTIWLKAIAETFGAFVDWPGNVTSDKVIRSSLALHHNVAKTVKDQVVLCQEGTSAKFTVEDIFKYTISVLMCASYRNQILHVFVRPALVAVAFQNGQSCRKEDVYSCFSYLHQVLSDEFIFFPGDLVKDFDEGLYLVMKSGAIQGSHTDLYVSEKGSAIISFLSDMFRPFLEGYQVICKYLLSTEFTDNFTEKRFVTEIRSYAAELILTGAIKYNEVLSVDMQKNALAALVRLGAVEKLKIANGNVYKVNKQTVMRVADMLVPMAPIKRAAVARL